MSELCAGTSGSGLLDSLAALLGFDYLSDLRFFPCVPELETLLPAIPADAFLLAQWTDAVHYLTGRHCAFASAELAKQHLMVYLAGIVRLEEQAAEGKDCMQ